MNGRAEAEDAIRLDAYVGITNTTVAPPLQICSQRSTSEETVRRLIHMDAAPHFRMAHPREEHLTPLLVAVGAANPDVQLGATKTSAATPVAAGAEVQVDATGSASAVAGKQAGRARLLFQGLMMGQPIESFAFD